MRHSHGIRWLSGHPWTGKTHFFNKRNALTNDSFNLRGDPARAHGYIQICYDSNLEASNQAEIDTIAGWKSYRIKRWTVNTLPAERQSILQGIGCLRWHLFLLAKTFGEKMSSEQWEHQIRTIPYPFSQSRTIRASTIRPPSAGMSRRTSTTSGQRSTWPL